MKIARSWLLFSGFLACLFLAACALPLGEDYIVPRNDLTGGNGGYIIDYNLETYVPLPYIGDPPVVQVTNRGDLEMNILWKDAEGNPLPMEDFDAFEAGKIYTADIQITPINGYQFFADQLFSYHPKKVDIQQDKGGETARTVTVTYYPAQNKPAGSSGRFIAISYKSDNKAAWSDNDGKTWKPAALPSFAIWRSLAYGDGRFVAIPDAGDQAAWSEDGGETWMAATLPFSADWRTGAYENGIFIVLAGGDSVSDKAAWSDDGGETWTAATLPSSAKWKSVKYGNGRFIAIAIGSNEVAGSDDNGKTWTKVGTLPGSPAPEWQVVFYGDGKFSVIAAHSDEAAWSDDNGETWTAATLPSSANWWSVSYGNGRAVAVAGGPSDKAAWSDDGGETWTAAALPSSASWLCVSYGNGRFVAIAGGEKNNSNKAAWSDDGGETWTAATLPSSANWYNLKYGKKS